VRSLAAAALLAGLASAPAAAANDPSSVAGIVAASGVAINAKALGAIHTLHFHGTTSIVGVAGTGDLWEDLRSGASAESSNAGPLSGAQGFDGTQVWNRDASGVVWNDGAPAARLIAIDSAYITRMALWSRGYGGATVTVAPAASTPGHHYDVLRIAPPGGSPFDLWIDAATHLPARAIVKAGVQSQTTIFGHYRVVKGVDLPFAVGTFDASGDQFDFAGTSVDVDAPATIVALQRPVMHVDDYDIPSGSTSIPFTLVDNHVDLPVMINGKGPYHFLFDTGGSNLIDSGVADALGLRGSGSAAASGVGSSTEQVAFATIDHLGIGDATLRHQVFAVVPVRAGFGVASGQPIDGLIGFEVLSRFVTTFDYADSRVILRMPSAPREPGGTTLPFTFNGQHADIACAIDGIDGRCDIDTGSRISLSVLTPFLAAHPTVVPPDASAVGANGFGIGGVALGRLGRTTLTIGSYTLPGLVTDLSSQTQGDFTDPFLAGNIGAGVWKRFTLTLDYGAQTVTLAPNASFAEHETYDRSGTFLLQQNGKIIVADVRPRTPAAEAGLRPGDTLTALAGKPAAGYALADVRALFRGPVGTAIPLVLTGRDGAQRSVILTLRDYV
jgi:hypothetical protein